eukprot:368350-Pyramimonas_sp.AAC.1
MESPRRFSDSVKDEGNSFFARACQVLGEIDWLNVEALCWCYMCQNYCRVTPPIGPNTIWIEIGGNTCTPWSIKGYQLGWLDPESLPSICWGS